MLAVEIVGAGVAAFLFTVVTTSLFRRVAIRFGLVRQSGGRHVHTGAIPLLGGAALVLGFLVVVLSHPTLVLTPSIRALLGGVLLLLLVGIVDDARDLPWPLLLLAQIGAAAMLIEGGVRIETIHHPFGGVFDLSQVPGLAAAVLLVWVVVVVNALNWLDGADGIAGGVSVVALLALAAVSLLPHVLQPPLAIIAVAGVGAALGFLFWNRPPARIFLGTSGSFVLGFVIAALAVLAGAKIATVAIVLLVPLADMTAVVVKRLMQGRPVTRGDTLHLHFALKRRGVAPWPLLFFYTGAALLLGGVALLVPQPMKTLLLTAGFAALVVALIRLDSPRKQEGQ